MDRRFPEENMRACPPALPHFWAPPPPRWRHLNLRAGSPPAGHLPQVQGLRRGLGQGAGAVPRHGAWGSCSRVPAHRPGNTAQGRRDCVGSAR